MITNYTDLQAAIIDFMARNDLTGNATTFISLAEARLNRLLDPVATDAILTGVTASRTVDVSALSILKPTALFFKLNGIGREILPKPDGGFIHTDSTGRPSFYSLDNTTITFDCPLDQPYPMRFVYTGRFALSDAVPTNQMLKENPDVYLAASIVWGSTYIKDVAGLGAWKQLLDEFIAEAKSINAQKKRGVLTADPALVFIGGYPYDNNGSLF